ncbi:hypothetical protein BCR34DRAFT_558439 [Clohesyomyces aquaticus]|uniref:Uncharacterized protein n=1 Tax=Clohesyomyces aquaticus TaxID=1231657 RepID=A0A1Y2A113_9PLEO|nr:hypothetical protein BCR34DRAFT_558439 [Clohesyomyces aquaticus]
MYLSYILILASSAALITAAPSTPITVREDDVILYGKGHYQLLKCDHFKQLQDLRRSNIVPPRPTYLDTPGFYSSLNSTSSPPRSKRDSSTIFIKNPVSSFLGWDILMSTVVKGAPTTINIATGFSIANSISVTSSSTLTLVKDFLQSSLSINYGQTWTTTQTQSFTAEVPEGKFGAFVSNPQTRRESGNVFEGVIGEEGSLTYYQADSFQDKTFGDLSWVDGVISLCTGDEFPLKRCLGEGTL